uniref:Frigida-like protein n=1 Tax=Trifolium medium TaxID=97028 RepID=A0A392P6M0_9FABA
MPLIDKRPFDNKSLLNNSIKKSKVTPFDNQDKDDTPLSKKTEMLVDKFAGKLFSSSKKEHELAKKMFKECKRKRHEEEKTLESKEVENMIKKMSCVEGIKDSMKKMEEKIGECVKEFVVKEARLFFKDLIREHKQCTMEHRTKERELDAMKKQIDGQVETLNSKKEDFELAKKLYEEQVDALRLKEERCTKREMDLESKDKLVEGRKKDLDLKEKQVEIRETEVELKKKQLEEKFMELHSKEEKFKAQMQKVKSFVSQMED